VPSQRGPQATKQAKQGGASRKGGQGKAGERRREFARRATGAATRPGSELHNYQAVVAAEFVAASLLVALTPIASRKASKSPVSGALSPYIPSDLVQLVAIGLVYLILEGLAAGPRAVARFAAWFGFLILLGVGLFEATRIAKVFQMLTGGGISTVVLTGAQAPATKGETGVPPLVPGGTPPPAPTKKPGG
jgi:hypothetical protein